MFTIKRIALAALALVVAGCALLPEHIDKATLAKLKRVAVVSLTADEFNRQYTGLTVFGNELEKDDISAWKVDDAYEARLRDILSTFGRFEVVRIPYDRKDLAAMDYIGGGMSSPAWPKPAWPVLQEKLKNLARTHSVDGLVVVLKRWTPDGLGTNQRFGGTGAYARGYGSSTRISLLHVISWVVLLDGATGEPLVARILSNNPDSNASYFQHSAPLEPLRPEISRAKLSEWTPTVTNEVRDKLLKLPDQAWEPTLRSLLRPQ